MRRPGRRRGSDEDAEDVVVRAGARTPDEVPSEASSRPGRRCEAQNQHDERAHAGGDFCRHRYGAGARFLFSFHPSEWLVYQSAGLPIAQR